MMPEFFCKSCALYRDVEMEVKRKSRSSICTDCQGRATQAVLSEVNSNIASTIEKEVNLAKSIKRANKQICEKQAEIKRRKDELEYRRDLEKADNYFDYGPD